MAPDLARLEEYHVARPATRKNLSSSVRFISSTKPLVRGVRTRVVRCFCGGPFARQRLHEPRSPLEIEGMK